MDIKTFDNEFYFYKTENFATIDVRVYFNFENTKENYIKSLILSSYLTETNEVYKTSKEIFDRSKELYRSAVFDSTCSKGYKTFFVHELKMLNPREIEEDYFNDALQYYKDILLKPNFENNKLDSDVFNRIKKQLIDKKRFSLSNPSLMSELLFYNNVIPNSITNNYRFYDINEFESIVNSISDADIIKFYNDLLNNYVASFVVGNINDNELELIKNLFNFTSTDFDYIYSGKDIISTKDIEIINKDTSQSNIYFVYGIKDYKNEYRYIYNVLKRIFRIPVHAVYRGNLGIVYSAFPDLIYSSGVFFIQANIDKKNKDIAISGLNEVFEILKDKDKLQKYLDEAKGFFDENLLFKSETVGAVIDDVECYALKSDLTSFDEMEKINDLTVDDIINHINKLEYKCMYYFKGDKDEK